MDQALIFGNQIVLEDAPLRGGLDTVITDSPLGMQCFYAKRHKFLCWEELLAMVHKYDKVYEPLNILLSRDGIEYQEEGRYETSVEADEVDREMEKFMMSCSCGFRYEKIPAIDKTQLREYITKQLKEK